MYEGHQFIKIGDNWVFDITEFLGYKVELDGSTVKNYLLAYTAIRDNGDIEFEKHIPVPSRVLKETLCVITNYEKEAFVSE